MSDRHTFRADWHDYNSGIYFVTICSKDKRHIFGSIKNSVMIMSDVGKIIERCILDIANHHTNVEIWNHVVMPNHIHMVINVGAQPAVVGTRYIASAPTIQTASAPTIQTASAPTIQTASAPTIQTASAPASQNMGCLRPPRHGEPCEDSHHNSNLAVVVGTFKAAVTRMVRTRCIASLPEHERMQPVWQSRYHEHIIRNQRAFENIMNYIDTNIEKWDQDCFYTNVSIAH